MAWSPDGRTLAVLSAHVARVHFVDAAWVVAHPEDERRGETWPQVSLAGDGEFVLGSNIAFSAADRVELDVCGYQLADLKRTGRPACSTVPQRRSLSVQTATYR